MLKKKSVRPRSACRMIVCVIALCMTFPTLAFGSVEKLSDDATQPGKSLAGIRPAQKVDIQFSLSEDASQEISIQCKGIENDALQNAIDNNNITLSLTRDTSREYLDPDKFPNAYEGGTFKSSWYTQKGTSGSSTPYAAKEQQFTPKDFKLSDGKLNLKIDSKCYFYTYSKKDKNWSVDYSVPHSNGGDFLDRCGYFILKASIEDKEIGSIRAKVVPYDSYRSVYELYDEIDKIAESDNNGLYVKKESMGRTTVNGYDMPYLIIADKKSSVDKWLKYTDEVENNPTGVLSKLQSGEYKGLRVPMVASNCHSNENAAVNGILEFARKLTNDENIPYNVIQSYTDKGKELLKEEMAKNETVIPSLIKPYVSQIGYIRGNDKGLSAPLDLETYYNVDKKTVNVRDMMKDVFFIIVPEMNLEGYEQNTRTPSAGYDINRDEANQTMNEDANLQHMLSKWNAMVFTEIHGRVTGCLIEPCTPPHEPNYEYDLIAEQFIELGEALGNGAIANNSQYNSFELPYRDYLKKSSTSPSGAEWTEPWDDMTTAYGSQYPVLIGTAGITYELPAYNDITSDRMVVYGLLNQGSYIQKNKIKLLINQAKLFERGIKNQNTNEMVEDWYVNQYDQSSQKQAALMRPTFHSKGENGNFYPECYIIPMDKEHQSNRLEAAEEVKYLTRNDCKVYRTESEIEFDHVKYPAGTIIVPLYQAKRSIVNSQLSDGTFISVWKDLYSESLAQRSHARGYDRIICAKPASYKTIMQATGNVMNYESTLSWLSDLKSDFSGVKDADTIIQNSSEDSSAAIIELLKKSRQVGMITSVDNQGDFIISYQDYLSVANKYTLNATGTDGEGIEASVIKHAPRVYVVGEANNNSSGYLHTTTVSGRYNYNFDMYAMKAMGLDITKNATKADVIIGSTNSMNQTALDCIKEGTPYLGHGLNGLKAVASILPTKTSSCDYGTDMLGFVEYPEKTMINSTYIKEKDAIMYQYGTYWFTEVPDNAKVLVKNSGKSPLQGCIGLFDSNLKAQFDKYNTGVIGFEYQKGDIDLALFANVLSHKAHQQDEFTYMSNFAFLRCLKSGEAGKYVTESNKNAPLKDALAAAEKRAQDAEEALKKAQEEASSPEDIAKLQAEVDAANAALKKFSTPQKVTKLKVKKGKKKAILHWKKVDGATKYQIYRSAKKSGKYKLVKTTRHTSATIKISKKTRKYYYKVRAIKKIKEGVLYGRYSTPTH